MKVSKFLLALSATVLLAGCGGGGASSSVPSSSKAPSSSASEVSKSETPSSSESKEVSSSSEQPVGTVITATTEQDWAFRTQIPIFSWVWGGENTGEWVNIAFEASAELRSVQFNLPDGCDHFLLVRCSEGTTTPNWDIKSGDEAGRIYNKTGDVAIESGVTTYTVTFGEYPSD